MLFLQKTFRRLGLRRHRRLAVQSDYTPGKLYNVKHLVSTIRIKNKFPLGY